MQTQQLAHRMVSAWDIPCTCSGMVIMRILMTNSVARCQLLCIFQVIVTKVQPPEGLRPRHYLKALAFHRGMTLSNMCFHLLELRLRFWIDADSELYGDCILKLDLLKPIMEARLLLLEIIFGQMLFSSNSYLSWNSQDFWLVVTFFKYWFNI